MKYHRRKFDQIRAEEHDRFGRLLAAQDRYNARCPSNPVDNESLRRMLAEMSFDAIIGALQAEMPLFDGNAPKTGENSEIEQFPSISGGLPEKLAKMRVFGRVNVIHGRIMDADNSALLADYFKNPPKLTIESGSNDLIPDTQRAALDAVRPKAGAIRALVLAAITKAGEYGATSDELAATLDIDRGTVQPRTTELKQEGAIFDSGMRRLNEHKRNCIVWRAV